MSQTDFNNSGGTLFAVFKSSGNIEYQTACSYPITKTIPPSFTLSPTTLPLLCSDTSSRTFTVTPANIPSGAVVTYQWSHNGWSEISTTATSKTLQPNSGTTLPSSVTVTPFINGVSQGTRTCTVTRSDFTSSATISGSATICSSVTYTMSGLLTGQTVSSWTLSDPSKATLSATSGTTTTVTKIGIGQVTLTATISNACNQTVTKTLNLFIGASSPNAPAVPTVCVNLRDGNNYLLPASQGAASYQLISSSPNLRMNGTTNLTFTTAPYMINFRALVAGNYTVTIKTTNICGTTTATFPVNAQNCSTGGRNSASYAVYPNPASSVIYITYEQATGSEEGFMKASNSVTETETLTTQLYDFGGNLVRTVNFAKSGTIPSIDISDLKKGIYVLKIIAKELEETHRIIIE